MSFKFRSFLTGKETPLLVACTAELVVGHVWTLGQRKYPSLLEVAHHCFGLLTKVS
jgi:hypothetical protein